MVVVEVLAMPLGRIQAAARRFDDLVYPQHLLGRLQIIREVLPLFGSNARLKWVVFSLDGPRRRRTSNQFLLQQKE